MKRFLFSAVIIAASTITATAQEVARLSNFGIVPSTLTYTGKPAPVGFDREKQEFTIFDTEFNVVKRFNYSCETAKSRSYDEMTTVKPSGAIVEREDSLHLNHYIENSVATTLDEMITLLSDIYYTNNWVGFTDYKGRTSCWSPDRTSFFASEWFGTSYPEEYFCIEDGHVIRIRVRYKPDFDQTAIDNAQWTIEGDVDENEYDDSPESFDYSDYDANIAFDEASIVCTQTLFNDDEKWEYIVPKYGAMKKDVGNYQISDSSEDGFILVRRVSEARPMTGFDIKNEVGEIVASINEGIGIYDVYKIGGNIYLYIWNQDADYNYDYILYKYDPKSTDIKEISRSEVKKANIRINGRSIMVEADAKDVDEVELIDMGGRKMASSNRKGVGNLTINASSAADGVYSIALKKRGRFVGAQKIILK